MEKDFGERIECKDSETYALLNFEEEDKTMFEYWSKKFLEDYKDEIGDNHVYVIDQYGTI